MPHVENGLYALEESAELLLIPGPLCLPASSVCWYTICCPPSQVPVEEEDEEEEAIKGAKRRARREN